MVHDICQLYLPFIIIYNYSEVWEHYCQTLSTQMNNRPSESFVASLFQSYIRICGQHIQPRASGFCHTCMRLFFNLGCAMQYCIAYLLWWYGENLSHWVYMFIRCFRLSWSVANTPKRWLLGNKSPPKNMILDSLHILYIIGSLNHK